MRLGGLYALERLAQNNPDQRQTIVNVLCAYLRTPFEPPEEETDQHRIGELIDFELVDARVDKLTCRQAKLVGYTSFDQATFTDTVYFNGARFDGPVAFDGAVFEHSARFDDVRFTHRAVFDRVRFNAKATFTEVTFQVARPGDDAVPALLASLERVGFVGANFAEGAPPELFRSSIGRMKDCRTNR